MATSNPPGAGLLDPGPPCHYADRMNTYGNATQAAPEPAYRPLV